MTEIVHKSKFYCELCEREIPIHVYGNKNSLFDVNREKGLIEWGKHYHWIDFHQICAICGQLVRSEELELLMNDGQVKIHKNYTDEYKEIKEGDESEPFLIVHQECIKKVK